MSIALLIRALATPWIVIRTLTWIARGEIDPWGMPPTLMAFGNLAMLLALLFFIWEPYIRQWRHARPQRQTQ